MDVKRRISIPTKCRKTVGPIVVITRNLDNGLNLYPKTVWGSGKTKAQHLNRRLSINEKHRGLARFLTTNEQADVDASGRILIPEHLATFANLKESVAFVGNEEGFQLFDAEIYKNIMLTQEEANAIANREEFQHLDIHTDV